MLPSACGSNDAPTAPGGNAGNGTGSAPANAGNGSTAGGIGTLNPTGGNGNASAGSANGSGGAPTGGGAGAMTGGTPGAGSNAGGTASGGVSAAGSANGGANGSPRGVTVTSRDFAVPSGTVFNVADDYFNDGFIPATPVANFGLHSQIITVVNADGSLDVAWLDYTNGKGKPWAVTTPGMIYLTHVDAALGTATTTPSGVSTYKLLGFTKDESGAFYLAYNKDHPFKTDKQGDQNNLNGNELHVTKLNGGAVAWDTLIFGDKDNNAEASLGDPGGAASGVLGYDPTNQKLVIYVGHSMMWDKVRHQAGFLRLLDPSSGVVQAPGGNDIIHFGAGWWYSHNFNQRLLVDGGKYYVLAHGDAYARQLGFARWSPGKYAKDNDTDFNESYFKIDGNEGDNNTNAQTGQLAKLPDGRFVIVHTTSQGRSARDVRVVLANGGTGKPEGTPLWLTTNQGTVQATMPKVALCGDKLLVTYASWDSSKKHVLTWYAALLDDALSVVAVPQALPEGVEFVDSAPLFRFDGGPNAGRVGWVSGNAQHSLSVRVAQLSN